MPRPSKDVRILIPGACDYVILYGKSDLADVIKDRSGSSRAFLKPSSRSLKTDASARPGARPAAGPTSPRRRPPGPSRARRGAGVLEAPLARGPDVLPREGLSQVNKDQLLKTLYLCFICKMVMVWVFMQRYSAPAAGSAGRESGNPPRWGCAPR